MKKESKPVKAYKGFNKHMQCTPNGKIFQYEIGKEYKEDEAYLCHCGFHACENPLDVLSYYNNIDDKFCEVELDKIDPNRNKDSKICGKKIKIGIEIGFLGLFKAGIEWIKNKTIFTKEDFEKLLSSYNAKISSSGDAKIGSSGDYAQIGSSGHSTKIGSSGDYAQIGSSGHSTKIGSSGDYAQIGSSGNRAQIGSSGHSTKIGSSGYSTKIGSSGDYAQIGSSGDGAKIGSSGDYAQIGSSGNRAQIGSSGYSTKIGSSGDDAKIGSSGDDCVIMCAGINSSAKAKIGSWITLAEWKYSEEKQKYIPFSVVTKQVDGIEIKEDVYYTLQDGKFKELE